MKGLRLLMETGETWNIAKYATDSGYQLMIADQPEDAFRIVTQTLIFLRSGMRTSQSSRS